MRLTAAFFAENVEASSNSGKFHVFGGGFDAIELESVPANVPLNALMKFEVLPEEQCLPHSLEIEVREPSGRVRERPPAISMNTIKSVIGPDEPNGAMVVLQVGFHFDEFGRHRIGIIVDGIELGEMRLYVKQRATTNSE